MKIEFGEIWTEILAESEKNWRLAEVSLRIACMQFYPQLEINKYLQRLDSGISEVKKNISDRKNQKELLTALNNYLYVQQGFSGSHDDYYDPKNSFLNDVLDRKKGIPISLSIIYMDMAERLGFHAQGVNFPGHFIIRIRLHDNDEWTYIDPYHEGRHLGMSDLNDLYKQQTGNFSSIDQKSNILQPASKRNIIVRMLRNLKMIYIEKKEIENSLLTIEMILSLVGNSADEIRDRGMIYHHIGYHTGAIADLKNYIQLVPDAKEKKVIESILDSMYGHETYLH